MINLDVILANLGKTKGKTPIDASLIRGLVEELRACRATKVKLYEALESALAGMRHVERHYLPSCSAAAEMWTFVNGYGGSPNAQELLDKGSVVIRIGAGTTVRTAIEEAATGQVVAIPQGTHYGHEGSPNAQESLNKENTCQD